MNGITVNYFVATIERLQGSNAFYTKTVINLEDSTISCVGSFLSPSDYVSKICRETRWKAYHRLLDDLDKRIRESIIGYNSGRCSGECRPIVLVAPYGSGKTELAKHVCHWCWSQGIPAIIVNLSEIYRYIESESRQWRKRYGREFKFTDDELKDLLEKFFKGKLESVFSEMPEALKNVVSNYFNGLVRGALIIDEIEETFNEFKKLIVYETTPWRAVFDAVRERRLSFFPILLYGPSSELAETVHMSGVWRAQVLSISPLPPSQIEREFLKELEDPLLRKLLANTLFWLGRGRVGHVSNLVSARIVDISMAKFREIEQDRKYLSKLKNMWTELEELLRREIVEGIVVFDELQYERHLEEVEVYERDLIKLLIAFVGPVPESRLSTVFDVESVRGVRLQKIIRSRRFVSKDALVKAIVDVANKLSRGQRDTLLYLESVLDTVFDAWSYNDVLLLPVKDGYYDVEALEVLKDIAGAIAFEMYRSDVAEVLDKIDLYDVIVKLSGTVYMGELEEEYYAVNPRVLVEVYTPIAVKPLVACSKTVSRQTLSRKVKEYLEETNGLLREDTIVSLLESLSVSIKDILKEHGRYIHVVFEQDAERWIDHVKTSVIKTLYQAEIQRREVKRTTRADKSEIPVHIVLLLSEQEHSEKWRNLVVSGLKPFVEIGLVDIADTTPRLSLFIKGLLYYRSICPDESLSPHDKFIMTQYAGAIAKLIGESIARAISKRNEVAGSLWVLQNNEKVKRLMSGYGHEIGGGQAKYVYIVASSPNEEGYNHVKDSLMNVMMSLEAIKRSINAYVEELEKIAKTKETSRLVQTLFAEIKLLSEKGAREFYGYAIELAKIVNDYAERDEHVKSLREFTGYLLGSTLVDKQVCIELLEGGSILDKLKEVLQLYGQMGLVHDMDRDPVLPIIAGPLVLKRLDILCKDHRSDMILRVNSSIQDITNQLNRLKNTYESLTRELNQLTRLTKQFNVKAEVERLHDLITVLNDFINKMEALVDYVKKNSNELWKYDFAVSKLFKETVLSMVVERLAQNSRALESSVGDILQLIKDVNTSLNEIVEKYEDLAKRREELKSIIGRDVISVLAEDLRRIFSGYLRLDELAEVLNKYVEGRYIEELIQTVNEERGVLERFDRIRREFDELRKMIEEL